MKPAMLGIILCGGESTRMGSDKALLQNPYGISWAKAAMDKMTLVGFPVFFSVNPQQLSIFENLFPKNQLIPDDDSLLVKGPLRGLLSAHVRYPEHDLFILACDMPLMSFSILKELYDHHPANKAGAQVHIFTSHAGPEPLCGIYTAKGMNYIAYLYQYQLLANYSMKWILEQVPTALYPLSTQHQTCFQNINTPAELSRL